jgi:hypothetical protein
VIWLLICINDCFGRILIRPELTDSKKTPDKSDDILTARTGVQSSLPFSRSKSGAPLETGSVMGLGCRFRNQGHWRTSRPA